MNRLSYLTQRVVRNLLPDGLASLGRRHFGGIPGGESYDPEFFASHYVDSLARLGRSLEGAKVLIFGHGPSYGFACAILAAGAEHVYLWDPYAAPDDLANDRWMKRYPQYLERRGRRVVPHAGWLTLIEPDGEPEAVVFPIVDIVLSTSVFEHLEDPELWAGKLAEATDAEGVNLHWVDLRDHFFHSPFEMLCYPEGTWRRWLNPRQNLNRWRLEDYRRVFRRHFEEVSVRTLHENRELLEANRHRIRQEFLTGDDTVDAALEIEVAASAPKRAAEA